MLSLVFGKFFQKGDKSFPVYILTGRLLYTCFSTGTKNAMKSIRQHAGMIKKVYVPKYIYPLSGVLFNFVIFAISLIVLVGAMFVFSVKPTLWIFTAIVPLMMLFLLTFGAGMILSTMSVFFRDLEYLWDVALMLIMYTCAIFYVPEQLNANQWIFKLNPLYAIIKDFRAAIYGENMFASPAWVIMPAAVSVLSVIVGVLMFKKHQDNFILHI